MAFSFTSFPHCPRFFRIFATTGGLIFITTGVSRAAELRASDGRPDDYFGWSVSLSGSTGLVSAYWDDDKGTDSGSAYVFRGVGASGATVTQNVHLIASDGAADDRFGSSVSLFGNIGLIGAHYDDKDSNNLDAGSAYVFRGLDTATGTLHQVLKLTASDAATGDHFGESVSLYGSIGLVGSRFDDDRGSNSGSAYVFRNLDTATGSLTQSTKLTALDGADADYFGSSVSLFGTIGLVGAWGDDAGAGSAYVFRGLDVAGASKTQELTYKIPEKKYDFRCMQDTLG